HRLYGRNGRILPRDGRLDRLRRGQVARDRARGDRGYARRLSRPVQWRQYREDAGPPVRRLAFALLLLAAPAAAGAQQRDGIEAGAGFGAAGISGCDTDLRYLNQVFGWQASWQRDWEGLATASDRELRAAIAQWRTAPAALQRDEAALAK